MVAIIEHWRNVSDQKSLSPYGLESLELTDEPLDLVTGIVPALQDVEVVLVASEGIQSDDLGVGE